LTYACEKIHSDFWENIFAKLKWYILRLLFFFWVTLVWSNQHCIINEFNRIENISHVTFEHKTVDYSGENSVLIKVRQNSLQ